MMHIGEMCQPEVVCCGPAESIGGIARLMRHHHVGDVVVVTAAAQGGVPVGVVTDRDIVIEAVAADVDLDLLTAGDIMSSPLITVPETCSLSEAIQRLAGSGVRRVPVVRKDGSLAGIVSVDDVITRLAGLLSGAALVLVEQAERESEERP